MNILIVAPAQRGSTRGNRITADRYAKLLQQLGHSVAVEDSSNAFPLSRLSDFELLIALHAGRSAEAISEFKKLTPSRPCVVVLTGTDLHLGLNENNDVLNSLEFADRIVVLEPEGLKCLSPPNVAKSRVIFQSAIPVVNPAQPLQRNFEVTLIGHLRPVKDPFLAVEATRLLPTDSSIKVTHIGEALSPAMQERALYESSHNARYRWLGKRSHAETQRRLARSRLTILTSEVEGAPSVISEAIVNHIPVLATRIAASIGLLGADYPGLFEVHKAAELAQLMYRSETDQAFYELLLKHCARAANKFSPNRELASWESLLRELV